MNFRSKLRAFFRREKIDGDMAEEMRAHVELQTDLNLRAGLSAGEARRAALRQFGNVTLIQERVRDQRSFGWLERSWTDLRFAGRSLRRAPGFSLAVLFTLAICIGPNAATLSALYALVLKPLPFPEPAQLVTVRNVAEKSGGQSLPSSVPQYRDFKARAGAFAGFAAVRHDHVTFDEDGAAFRAANDVVSADFFRVLRVQPVLGRFFEDEEEVAGRDHVLVLGERFWASHYQADASVIGRVVRLGGQPFMIIGVAPRTLECLNQPTDFFQPYAPTASKLDPQARYRGEFTLYGRLKPGGSLRAGGEQLTVLEADFRRDVATPQIRDFIDAAGFRLSIEPLHPGNVVGETQALWLLQGGALLVLLIGCVNVVNLYLARLNAKRRELAIRVALGAGRTALLRQMLAESLLLTSGAAALGIGLALAALRIFNAYLPIMVSGAPPVTFDAAVAGGMAVAAFGIALLVGLLPLHLVWRSGLRVGESSNTSSSAATRAASGLLVMAQVSVAVVLLMGASLLLRSFAEVMAVDPGFDAAHVVQGRINLPGRYSQPADNIGLQRRILESFATIPEAQSVAQSLDAPITPNVRPVPFALRGELKAGGEGQRLIHIDAVSPDFFATMNMRIVAGRGFNPADDFSKTPVAIVDETFARRYFPGRVVEGQEIYLSRGLPMAVDAWPRIVGVVSRAQLTGLDSRDDLPMVFVPLVGYRTSAFEVLVRSPRPAAEILREMRLKLRDIDPALPLYGTASLQEELTTLLTARRGITLLLGIFSGLALLLATIGLYGVLSYDVSQRTREIGIRTAIGAAPGQILRLILGQGMTRTAIGLVVGLVGALLFGRALHALLFNVTPFDPVSLTAIPVGLLAIALVACGIPARRAAKVDPIVALRAE